LCIFFPGFRDAPEVPCVRKRLEEPSVSEADRTWLLGQFSSGENLCELAGRPFVVEDALAETAQRFLVSEDPDRRAGAAALLGGHNTPATMSRLRPMAHGDPEVSVRVAAIGLLGRIGDAETLAFLRAYPLPAEEALRAWLEGTLKEAIARLERKLPK